jgi:hypothetical protein
MMGYGAHPPFISTNGPGPSGGCWSTGRSLKTWGYRLSRRTTSCFSLAGSSIEPTALAAVLARAGWTWLLR